jgi:purine-binding chemotaxis protein CheW
MRRKIMSGQTVQLAEKVAALRDTFDRAFAAAPDTEAAPVENLVAVRLSHEPFAIRLSDISGLFADKAVVSLPASAPALLGVAGFRGSIVPVFSLPALLGYAGEGALRWLVLAGGERRVGLAFDRFEGHLQVPRSAIAADEKGERQRRFVKEIIRAPDGARPLIHMASVIEAIEAQSTDSNSQREQ